MAYEMNGFPVGGLDSASVMAEVEQVRSFTQSAEAQQIRDTIMSTPEGEMLYAGMREAVVSSLPDMNAQITIAQDELVGIIQASGGSPELVSSVQQVMSDPSLMADAARMQDIRQQLTTLNVQNPAVQESLDAVNRRIVEPVKEFVSDTAQDIREFLDPTQPHDLEIGKYTVGPEVPPGGEAPGPDTLTRVPDASATPEQVAEFDRRAKAYAEAQSVELDYGKVESEYGSLAWYLNETRDSEQLTRDSTTAEDYTILSHLSYTRKFSSDPDYRIAAGREGITVQQYCDALIAADAQASEKMSAKDRAFLIALRNNKRYAGLNIDHVDASDTGVVNTSIVTVSTGDNHAIVCVQGTNGEVIDWNNDMDFTRTELTAEEKWIIDRVSEYAGDYDSFDATGHSQGGRDAITLGAYLDGKDGANLRKVYSLDGPGYPSSFLKENGERFDSINDKIYQIFPRDSYVGHLMNRVGSEDNIYYVDATGAGSGFDFMTHDDDRWCLWNKNGEPGYQYRQQSFVSGMVRSVSTFLIDELPPEVLGESLPVVLRLMSDPNDPSKLSFSGENIAANLKNISIGDGAELLNVVLLTVSEGVLEIIDEISPWLDLAEGILAIASLIPWPGAPFCATALAVIHSIQDVLEIVSIALEIAAELMSAIAEWVARKKKEQREAYMATHKSILVNYQALRDAKRYMEEASAKLKLAGENCDYMWNHFKKKEAKGIEKLLEGIKSIVWEIVDVFVNPREALNRVKNRMVAAGVDLVFLRENPYCSKASDGIYRIIECAKNIHSDHGYYHDSSESEFSANPGQMASKAEEGEETVQTLVADVENAQTSIHTAGTVWEADDYSQLRQNTDACVEGILEALQAVKEDYTLIKSIAQAYQNLQETAVIEFQGAAQ